MSWWEYKQSVEVGAGDPGFYALIMAAMRKADSRNAYALAQAFPETWDELQARYNAPGGVLATDPESEQIKVLGKVINGG